MQNNKEKINYLIFYFRFLYAFHNRDFRTAFRKTLCRSFICCQERRRASLASSIGLPPATPSGESQRTNANMKHNRIIRSIANMKDRQITNKNNLNSLGNDLNSLGNAALDISNGNLASGVSSKRNSCL
jgi:hypothetical protein